PIIASKHDPSVIYHAGNKLLKTTDRGITWEEISDDLTKNDSTHIGWGGGPITNEGAGGEIYHVIYYVAESPHTPAVIYTGADDGLIHVTRNGGLTWANISIPNVSEGMVNQIEVSPHDPATVYVAYNRYKFNDFTPHIFKSTNYGETWTRLVDGIDSEAHVRVVREDPNQKDLLYAGTELGLYVSFDGGIKWNKFQQNLPIVPITDLMVKDNDLLVATQGRAFWVLDDLNPLYELNAVKESSFFVYEPDDAIRDNAFRTGNTSLGQNPYPGFSIMYYIKDNVDSIPLKVEFMDASGETVRTFSTASTQREEKISKKSGMNRLNWNLALPNPEGVDGVFMGLGAGGHRVAPGKYSVKFTYGDQILSKEIEVKPDPRWETTSAQYAEQQDYLMKLRAAIDELQTVANDLRSVRSQVNDLKARISQEDYPDVHAMADSIVSQITTVEDLLIQPNQKTFQDVINFENKIEAQLLHIYGTIDGIEPPITGGQKQRAEDVMREAYDAFEEAAFVNLLLGDLMKMIRTEEVPFIAPKKKK
ncbi:MAG TPA: glycosyl hydrolase, partial [Roseivirga sp.]